MPLLLTLSLIAFACGLSFRSTDPLLPLIADDFGIGIGEAALLASAFTLPYAAMQLVLGPVGDAIGKARLMRGSILVLTLGVFASALAPGFGSLMGARIVAGAFAGGLIPVALAMMGDRIPFEERQVAISRVMLALIMGQLAGSSAAGMLSALVGWRGVHGTVAVITALVALAALLHLKGRAVARTPLSLAGAAARYHTVFRNPRAPIVLFVVGAEGFLFFGLFPFVAPLLLLHRSGGVFEAGLIIAAFAAGGLAYTALVSWLLRVLGQRRMMVIGGVMGGLATLIAGSPLPWTAAAALFAVMGFAFFLIHSTLQTEATELAPSARGSALALFACAFFVGQGLGVVAARDAAEAFGLAGVFAAAGLLMALLGLFAATRLGRS